MAARSEEVLEEGRCLQGDGLAPLTETESTLWRNGCRTYNGLNDQILIAQVVEETSSLRLVHVERLLLRVFAPGEAFGDSKRRVQARFPFAGDHYALWVTDPRIETTYRAKEDGHYRLGECYLTISLGEPYQEHCYKLVAAVIERPGDRP